MELRIVGSQELYDDRRAGNINGRRKQEMNVRIVSSAVLASVMLLAGVPAIAQTHPDLSGAWTIDAARSDPAPAPAGGGRGRGGLPPNQILIRQTPADLSIQRGAQTITYSFDGTETFAFIQGEVRATAAWDGDKFVISWKKEFYAGPAQGYVTTTGKYVYSLAGSVLTEESTTVSPKSTTTSKTVFTRN
jgi:hypothetical protein